MTLASAFALTLVMFVLALTPGPGVFIAVAAGLRVSPRRIAALITGIITGDIIFLMLSIFGLSWVATHLHGAFLVVQYLGAAYLCYLGVKILKDRNRVSLEGSVSATPKGQAFGCKTGLLITLANPKVIFFYVSFLPQFMDLQA